IDRTTGRLVRAGLLGGLLVLSAGCADKGPKLVPVEGKVYVDDQPVQTGERVTGYVVFHADQSKGNTNMEDIKATIGPDGSYKIYTRDKEGAPLGWYKVTVDLAQTNPKDPYDYKPIVPARFLEKDKSGLAFEVIEKPEPGRYDIKVPSK